MINVSSTWQVPIAQQPLDYATAIVVDFPAEGLELGSMLSAGVIGLSGQCEESSILSAGEYRIVETQDLQVSVSAQAEGTVEAVVVASTGKDAELSCSVCVSDLAAELESLSEQVDFDLAHKFTFTVNCSAPAELVVRSVSAKWRHVRANNHYRVGRSICIFKSYFKL